MQDIFSLNPNVSAIDLKDAIHCRINKTKAILTCVMFSSEFVRSDMSIDNHTIYHALWAADEYLDELEKIFQQLELLN